MDKTIIVFSGMPASGKDTITKMLCAEEDSPFVPFVKHKTFNNESEKSDSYINISKDEFESKIHCGDFLQYNFCYDKYYGIERNSLRDILNDEKIPIIHIGRIEYYYDFENALNSLLRDSGITYRLIHILLWETEANLERRIREKVSSLPEQERKLAAIHQEFQDNKEMFNENKNPYSYIIRNNDREKTCTAIKEIVESNTCDLETSSVDFMTYVLQSHDLNLEGKRNNTNTVRIRCRGSIPSYTIRNRIFDRDLEIESLSFPPNHDKLKFENCIFGNIKLSKINCNRINFVNCSVQGELRIYQGNTAAIKIRSCHPIQQITFEEVNFGKADLMLTVTDSEIDKLIVASTHISELKFSDSSSHCRSLRFVREGNADLIELSCPVDKIIIRTLPIILLKKQGHIESVEVESIEKNLLHTYEIGVIRNNKGGHIEDDLARYKLIILAVYNSFERRKMFSESDICLFEIRRLGVLIKRSSYPLLWKFFFLIEQFFTEKCFGWGIRIRNNLFTMLAVVSTFSCIYFGISSHSKENMLSFSKCLQISINRFFLIGADEFGYEFLGYFESLESIMGVLLLTVVTGVLVRKIIR